MSRWHRNLRSIAENGRLGTILAKESDGREVPKRTVIDRQPMHCFRVQQSRYSPALIRNKESVVDPRDIIFMKLCRCFIPARHDSQRESSVRDSN